MALSIQDRPTIVSIEQLCEIIEWGLKSQSSSSLDAAKRIRVKSVCLLNDNTLVCEFFPYSHNQIELKGEISFIVSFMSGFCEENPYTPQNLKWFAVRAYSETDQEIMYALSSREAAKYASKGQSIEWLKNTHFQDNSPDHRLSIAKRKISEIENALRTVICQVLSAKQGNQWWTVCVQKGIRTNAERAYRSQTGTSSSSGEDLIKYTYLLDVKKIIYGQWDSFAHVFPDRTEFEYDLDKLNSIRRDEAHNRPISEDSLRALDQIHHRLLGYISNSYPELVHGFLRENWRNSIMRILQDFSNTQSQPDIRSDLDLKSAVVSIKAMILQLTDTETRLLSVPVPPGKGSLHDELMTVMHDLKGSLEDLIRSGELGDMAGIEEAVKANEVARHKSKAFQERLLMSEL
jgi:hypothetical protein